MASVAKTGSDRLTVRRLLEAAAHEFARHGFAATRIRDVVEAAEANLAAVNYHFGGKGGLYRAALAMLAERARDEMPLESPALRKRPPEERFRAFARLMLTRLAGASASPAGRILAHELLDPTPAFGTAIHELWRPQWSLLSGIVAALLGPCATDEDVRFTSLAVAGQWISFPFTRRLVEIQDLALASEPGLDERIADQGVNFCLAAIRARRAQLEEAQVAAKAGKRRTDGCGGVAFARRPVVGVGTGKVQGAGK